MLLPCKPNTFPTNQIMAFQKQYATIVYASSTTTDPF